MQMVVVIEADDVKVEAYTWFAEVSRNGVAFEQIRHVGPESILRIRVSYQLSRPKRQIRINHHAMTRKSARISFGFSLAQKYEMRKKRYARNCCSDHVRTHR